MVDWNKLKRKCPNCGLREVRPINLFKRKYVFRNGRWKLKEIQKLQCDACGYQFWPDEDN